jgi:hypothetical protein
MGSTVHVRQSAARLLCRRIRTSHDGHPERLDSFRAQHGTVRGNHRPRLVPCRMVQARGELGRRVMPATGRTQVVEGVMTMVLVLRISPSATTIAPGAITTTKPVPTAVLVAKVRVKVWVAAL